MELKSELGQERSDRLSPDRTALIDIFKPESESWQASITAEPKSKPQPTLQQLEEEENEKGKFHIACQKSF